MIPTFQLGQFGRSIGGPNGPTDPYFSSRLLLCHFEGTNGQTTTTDSSSYAWTLSNEGTSLSTARSKFGASSSGGDNLGWLMPYPGSNPWNSGSGFTIEYWAYYTATPSGLDRGFTNWGSFGNYGIIVERHNATQFVFHYTFNGVSISGPGIFTPSDAGSSLDTWHFFAFDYDNTEGIFRMYVNGTQVYSYTITGGGAVNFANTPSSFGYSSNATAWFDEYRLSNRAEYKGTCVVPTAPFPNS